MARLRWDSVVARCNALGLSRAEMARRAGLSESTVTKGLRRNSVLQGSTRRVVEMVLAAAEVTGDVQDKGQGDA